MKYLPYICGITLIVIFSVTSCDDEDTIIEIPGENDYLITEDLFNASSLVSFDLVMSTLADDTSAECFRLTFSSNPVASGPFCPETIDDIAGMGFYDGAIG